MSKMSWVHAELTEKASELGFESIEEAERNGYEISMDGMNPILRPNAKKQLELAHKTWLKERDELLEELRDLRDAYMGVEHTEDVLEKTIDFIKKGEC